MENDAKEKRLPAPYIAWKSFTSFLANMKGKLPEQIDTSVLTTMSGTAKSQLLSALKFLDLIWPDGTVKDSLKKLSETYNTPKWKEVLGAFLKNAYGSVITDLNIVTATPAMLRERFKNFGGVEGTTIDNAMRFYISGLKEAEIPFSPHLVVRASRGTTGTKRRSTGRASEPDEPENETEPTEGTFRVPFDVLGVVGAAFIPEDIDVEQWKAVSDYVATVIGYRLRARKV